MNNKKIIKTSILKDLYFSMQRIRLIEEGIAQRYKKNLMRCPVHLSVGQEAVASGVCYSLKKNDLVLSAHRSHAHYLAKGGSFKSMLNEIHGKKDGCAGGKGGSMHLIDTNAGFIAAVPIVGSTIPIAVGASWGLELQKKNTLVCVFFGDGATEEGVFQESLNFASLHNLKILFICENNFYSVYTNIYTRRDKSFSLKKFVESHGINYFRGDGNNVQDVYDKTQKAISYIKSNNKAALINFDTFRWLEHCGPNWDDHLNYRNKNELEKWMKKDPIKRIKSNLLKREKFDQDYFNKINKKINHEIVNTFKHAENSNFPSLRDLETNIYAK